MTTSTATPRIALVSSDADRTTYAATPRRELSRSVAGVTAFTVARLAFVPLIILSLGRNPLLLAGLLLAFICADLYDGVLARHYEVDDAARRALDSVIDRAATWPVFVAMALLHYCPVWCVAALITRDLYCGWLCRSIIVRRVAVRADWLYRSFNLLLALWVFLVSSFTAWWLPVLIAPVLGFGLIVALDLRRACNIINGDPSFADTVISASVLRSRSRSHASASA
jgi:phosphatidylglycerophosphate synthase